jgi:hypothetical protein
MPQTLRLIFNVVIRDCCMSSNPIVPKRDSSVVPLDADLEILPMRDVLMVLC